MIDPIRDAIPHRPPFLFVDQIVEQDEDRIVVEWTLDPELDFFRGHYPGRPITPGVLLCECAIQAGAILCAGDDRDATPEGAVPVLTRLGDARFKRMVEPGDTVRVEVTLTERVGPARYMKAKVTRGNELVLRLAYTVAVAQAPAGRGA